MNRYSTKPPWGHPNSDNILLQEALSLYDQGIGVYLTDLATNNKIGKYSEFDPIDDRDLLSQLCTEVPDANLNIAIDQIYGLVALAVGVGSGKDLADESFAELCRFHGTPETIGYSLPTGEKYYLFRFGDENFDVRNLPGLALLKSNGAIKVFPSVIGGRSVQKIGTSAKLLGLSDWLRQAGNSTISDLTSQEQDLIAAETDDTLATNEPFHEEPAPDAEPAAKQLPAIIEAKEYEFSDEQSEEPGNSDDYADLSDDEVLAEIAKQITLFRDELSVPYYFCEGTPYPASSKYVRNWLRHQFLISRKRMPNDRMVREIFEMLESMARFNSPQIRLFNRIARDGDNIVYALNGKQHIIVSVQGWKIEASKPLFRTYKHQQDQVVPIRGGNVWKVFQYIHVPEEKKLLVIVYLICLFVPDIAHPVLAGCGDQGSAKSFTTNIMNRLVDPSITEKVILPKNERDLIQTLRQKYVTVFDNISVLSQRISDILCQVCTGGGISLRQLYTDDGENIAQFRHVVILNSISMPIINADLMDRAIILKHTRIPSECRKTEDELLNAFEADKPEILGGIFDTLAKAMAIYPTVQLSKSPRLADFAKWGYAVAEALGESGEQFLKDYETNVSNQSEGVVNNNVLCQAVLTLMVDNSSFERSVADTHIELKRLAGEDAKDGTFPKLPHHLRGYLERLQPTLLEHGISYLFSERDKAGVKITFSNAKVTASTGNSAKTGTPDTPDTQPADFNPVNNQNNVSDVPDVANLPTFDFGGEELYV